jgi:hypothetical protein
MSSMIYRSVLRIPFIAGFPLLFTLASCSHSFEGDSLDLGFYQWNLWADTLAETTHEPSCGWEEFERGVGQLVRIPARMNDYLAGAGKNGTFQESFKGVAWYHCRFSLPKIWEQQPMLLVFAGAGPQVEVYLNESLVGVHRGGMAPFSLDVTGIIYHVRDNHLAIRISDPDGTGGGITGEIRVKPVEASGSGPSANP